MKGCLKLSPMHSPVHSQHNEHDSQARCCNTPTTASSSSTDDAASTTPTQNHSQTHRKCVAFCAEGSETVYTADEWDRTPAEPARNLSYQDLLELKEIQRSLPHANQPADVITGKPGKQFLSGVPIVLLPLLSSDASPSGGAQSKQPCSVEQGRTNGNGIGWGPPGLIRQPQTTPARSSFPFPPRPGPFSIPVSKSTFASIPISQPGPNLQSPKSALPPPISPTSPYPSSYSNHPSTTSTSASYPYSSFHTLPPQTQTQTQSRTSWTRPPSLSHLLPALPIKPREKPKFEFITVLDPGTRTGASSGPRPVVTSEGADGVEVTTAKVGHPTVSRDPPSKLSSGLIETDHHDDEHDCEDHDLDHDLNSVTSSSSCPSLCTSCPSSCSASEVDTDPEHDPDMETEARYYSPNGYFGLDRGRRAIESDAQDWADRNGAAKLVRPRTTLNNPLSLYSPSPFVDDEVERPKAIKKPELKKERKFIVVNDMEIELDDSGSEDEDDSGLLERITTDTTRETTTTTTTTTTMTQTTEKTTTTTTSSGSPSSPLSIVAPIPVKSLGGSHSPSLPSSASLMTPPSTPPRYGSHTSMYNYKLMHSPIANRGRVKVVQKTGHVVASSTCRERSGSVGSDTSCGTSPSRSAKTRMGSPAKFKSKTS